MQTSTDYLKQILHVVSSIDQSMRKEGAAQRTGEAKRPDSGGSTSIFKGVGLQLKQMFSVNYKGSKSFFGFTQKLLDLAEKTPDKNVEKLKILTSSFEGLSVSLPKLSSGLDELGKLKERRVNRAINSLVLLYEFLDKVGDGRKARKIERSMKMFENLGRSLRDIAKPIKTISMSLINLSLGIVAFAASILLAGKILGLAGGNAVFNFLIVSILGIAMVFGVLALANRVVDKGTDTIKKIGVGMAFLSLGIVSFALAIALVPAILGMGSIGAGILAVTGIIVLSGLIFAGIGLLKGPIEQGVVVAASMGMGMAFLAAGVLVMALSARAITGLAGDDAVNKKGEKRGKFGQLMSDIGPGLGVMGIVLVSSALLFAGMGALAPVLLPGIGVGLAMSAALILFSISVKKLVNTANELGTKEEIYTSVEKTIGGVLKGFLDGIMVLSDGKKGAKGVAAFIKNSAAIFAGTGVLLSMSLALSQFAKALTAFAELENMRVIEGYDKDGKPRFGEKINIKDVSDNITHSISTFLKALIASTSGLSRKEAGAIRKMGRALTGRRGILSAVSTFADVLKTFAQFGSEGKIGYVEFVPDGTDEDGNAKFKQVPKTVLITEVVDNIISSFGTFVTKLTENTKEFELTGKHGRRMGHLAEALLGKKGMLGKEKYGILQPVEQFAETLTIYAKFGANNEIPILDPETGEVIDKVSVETIAKNILNSLTAFTKELGSRKIKQDTKQAEENLKIFDDIISKTNKISKSIDGIERLSKTLSELATSIGSLSMSLIDLDTDKLKNLSDVGAAYLAKTNDYGVANERITSVTSGQGVSSTPAPAPLASPGERRSGTTTSSTVKEPNWDLIAAQIGESVGNQLVTAMKSNQIKFEFSGAGSNSGVIEFG
jgi:hypothetical protein